MDPKCLEYAIACVNLHIIESVIGSLRETGDHATAFEVLDHCIAFYVIQSSTSHHDTTMPHRLFDLGADADTIVNRRTLMHCAKTSEMSQMIMKAGFTSFHIRDDSGKSPLMQVAYLVDAKTLIAFASHEQAADFDAKDTRGRTALHHLLGSRCVNQVYNNRAKYF